tara:strand:- start:443 stop:661 length:219 start_codon:yes stop_codon:yes gene_type:complete
MDIHLENIEKFDNLDLLTKAKMVFIFNCLENDWSVKKINNRYIFSKNHGGEKEVFLDNYLKRFIVKGLKLKD